MFLVLGLMLFAIDGLRPGTVGDEELVVTGEVARELEKQGGGSLPPAEIRRIVGSWIDEEVLVREARALGLDRSDVIVRRRLAQKMRRLLEDLNPVPDPSGADLEAYRAADPDRYRHPDTVTFEQIFLSRAKHGDGIEVVAERALEAVRREPGAFRRLGDPFVTGRAVETIAARELERHFGKRFAETVAGLPVGTWEGPVASSFGLHLVRVTGRTPGAPMTVAEAGKALRRDWADAEEARRLREELEERLARYRVVTAP